VAVTVRAIRDDEATVALLAVVRVLMDDAFAGDFSDVDWDHTFGGTRVVVEEGGTVVAHAAVVARVLEIGGRPFRAGYVEGVATAPGCQRRGLGSAVMREVAFMLERQYEIGALSTDAQPFYERLGWERWRGPTFARGAGGVARTEEEDDGVMVLRFGPSAGVDLTAAIVCEARQGDDW